MPRINAKHKICVICEGLEDYAYFDRLCKLDVWSDAYEFTVINAKSASNIPARYQNEFQNENYELILIFCDTDKAPHREYSLIKKKRELCSRIFQRTYPDMRCRVDAIHNPDNVSGSTNFIVFLEHFEQGETEWIDEIKRHL